MTPIRTPEQLIECLGGEQSVAKDTMTTIEGVRHWLESDFIPNGWHLRMFVRAVTAGHVFDQHGMDRIFSIAPEETEAIADRLPWCLSTELAPPKPPPFWERIRREPAVGGKTSPIAQSPYCSQLARSRQCRRSFASYCASARSCALLSSMRKPLAIPARAMPSQISTD